jgi:hypothetical protein
VRTVPSATTSPVSSGVDVATLASAAILVSRLSGAIQNRLTLVKADRAPLTRIRGVREGPTIHKYSNGVAASEGIAGRGLEVGHGIGLMDSGHETTTTSELETYTARMDWAEKYGLKVLSLLVSHVGTQISKATNLD